MANSHTARRSPLFWLLFSFKGRLSRSIYWPSLLGLFCVNLALYFQLLGMTEEDAQGFLPLVMFPVALAALYANFAISIKRLHDVGYGGFLAIAIAIPFLNIVFAIWAGIMPGTSGPNKYGDAADVPPT